MLAPTSVACAGYDRWFLRSSVGPSPSSQYLGQVRGLTVKADLSPVVQNTKDWLQQRFPLKAGYVAVRDAARVGLSEGFSKPVLEAGAAALGVMLRGNWVGDFFVILHACDLDQVLWCFGVVVGVMQRELQKWGGTRVASQVRHAI